MDGRLVPHLSPVPPRSQAAEAGSIIEERANVAVCLLSYLVARRETVPLHIDINANDEMTAFSRAQSSRGAFRRMS
jgi:hypothetical protein